jgi:hypothetical protein
MNPIILKQWINLIGAGVALLALVGGVVPLVVKGLFALGEYRLKLRAEERVAQAEAANADVGLLKNFMELLNIACSAPPTLGKVIGRTARLQFSERSIKVRDIAMQAKSFHEMTLHPQLATSPANHPPRRL